MVKTFEILPEYLKTKAGSQVNNYRDWGIPLGRRFRALKLWFVLRSYGVEGIQAYLRNHMRMTRELVQQMEAHQDFELMAPVSMNLICFRYAPLSGGDLNYLNEQLLHRLNDSGKMYLTHTKLHGNYVLRLALGNAGLQENHVRNAWELIREVAATVPAQIIAR